MKPIIVITGVQASGKTTLGKALASEGEVFEYFPEIGGQLRRAVDFNVLEKRESFDTLVFENELKRDAKLLQCPRIPVVETWHIGNLAYAAVRNRHIYDHYLDAVSSSFKHFRPVVFIVNTDWQNFLQRATEKISQKEIEPFLLFYNDVLFNLFNVCSLLGVKPFTIFNNTTVEVALEDMKRWLKITFKELELKNVKI